MSSEFSLETYGVSVTLGLHFAFFFFSLAIFCDDFLRLMYLFFMDVCPISKHPVPST